jgi:hypothetical protein
MTMTFHSQAPSLTALDVNHGDAGLEIERLMFNPAYLDPQNPLHERAVTDVNVRLELLVGDAAYKPQQGFPTMSFTTKQEDK